MTAIDTWDDKLAVTWILLNAAAAMGTRITQDEIGILLGAEQPHVSRMFGALRDRGVSIVSRCQSGSRLETPADDPPFPLAWAAQALTTATAPDGWPDRCVAVLERAQGMAEAWAVL